MQTDSGKKISIIVPVYKVEAYLRRCVDSVLAQTYRDFELILVDDGSPDNCGRICDEYAEKVRRSRPEVKVKGREEGQDSRSRSRTTNCQLPTILVIHQKNGGEGAARNAGLAAAKGEWVFFLDGDDVMAPGALERLAEIIAAHPGEQLIRFGYDVFDDGGPLPDSAAADSRPRVVDVSKKIASEDYYVYVWQFLFKRSLIADMTFKRYKRGADRTFIVPVLCQRVDSFVATETVCYHYRKRDGSAVNSRPSVRVLCDEMDHRLDVAEIMDGCGKRVEYAGDWWIERYFTSKFPWIMIERDDEFDELRKLWRQRLRRARRLTGLSAYGRRFCWIHTLPGVRWLADMRMFPLMRKRSTVCRLVRRLRQTGEFERESRDR